ncbi:type VI secretion system baseplate subunit TssE [Desulfovibrio inopinatus]|uniref:type VI secretion system baseplate subunit TssE n=1 Tax=Desulfovibrio inopinatus TaxID=102109 RepID=UPI00041A5037|nr:type VI secretion system baseplate subunit TssE [Desulfovibrio inopinatus]
MHELRLLERIRDFEKNTTRSGEIDPQRLLQSVMRHLQKLLNTRQGSVPIDPEYGLADFTDLATNFGTDIMQELEENISMAIMRYEPRLADVDVEFDRDPADALSLRFKIKGRIAVESLKTPVVFESVVQSDGKISIMS